MGTRTARCAAWLMVAGAAGAVQAEDWGTIGNTPSGFMFNGVWGRSGTEMVFVGSSQNFYTYDGATFTTRSATGLTSVLAVSGSGSDVVLAGSSGSYVIRAPGGANWTFTQHPISGSPFQAISAVSADAGYITGPTTAVDGRFAWNNLGNYTIVSAAGLTFTGVVVTGSTAVLCGQGGRITTHQSGVTTNRTTNVTETLNGIAASGTTVVAVGNTGRIIRSTDSGTTWTTINHGASTANLTAVAAAGGLFVAAGSGGTILRSTNGGQTWAADVTSTTQGFKGVWLATDGLTGFAVTSGTGGGTIQRWPRPAPLPFAVTSPADGTFVQTSGPTVSWTASVNADTYTVMVDNNADMLSPEFVQAGVAGTSLAVPADTLTTGVWHVRVTATGAGGSATATPNPGRFGVFAPTTGCDPDFNHDGNADQDDVTTLIGVIAGDTCP